MEVDLSRVLNGLPAMVWTAVPDGEIDFVNQRWSDYTGLSLGDADGWKWQSVIKTDDLAGLLERWRSILASGQPGEMEARVRRFDGQYRWFLVQTNPIRDDAGQIVKWCGVSIDIEDRKRAEDDVSRAHRSLIDAQRLSRTGSYIADLSTNDHHWSEELYRIYELQPGSKIDIDELRAMVHPEDRQSFETVLQLARTKGVGVDHYFRIVTRSGKVKHLHSVGSGTLSSDGRIEIVGALQDVTEQKAAEETLRRSEAFLAKGESASLTGTFSWDFETGVFTWSDGLYRIYEFEPATPITFELIATRYHPEDKAVIAGVAEQARSGAVANFDYGHRLLMPDGSIKHIHVIAHRSRNEDGRIEYFGAVQDVTQRFLADEARRAAEESLRLTQTRLAHAAEIATAAELSVSIAHEINQPLSGIITNANTCLRMLGSDPPNLDGARETARRTLRDGNRASEVVIRLRALFNKRPPMLELMDLNEAAREVIALLWSGIQANQVVLRTELAGDLPSVKGDRVQLQQVILNLIQNAVDSMTAVDDRVRQLLITTKRDEGDQVRLAVKDTGIGLAPESSDRMFESFYTTKSNGMGIGLAVSRSIIENHHGRLWAEPNDGPGVTFFFSIPRQSNDLTSVGGLDAARAAVGTDF